MDKNVMDKNEVLVAVLVVLVFISGFLIGGVCLFPEGKEIANEKWHKELISRDLGRINSELKFEFNDKKENK